MKMKKLTALALAGVLCLGMSTTAFAAASPLAKDAQKASDEYDNPVDIEGTPIKVDYGTGKNFTRWADTKNPKEASDNIKKDLNARLKELSENIGKATDPDEDYGKLSNGKVNLNLVAAMEAEQEALKKLDLTDKALFEVVTLEDLNLGENQSMPESGVDVKFYLDERLKDLDKMQPNQKIYLMHYVDGYWEVNEVPVLSDPDADGRLYVSGHFDSFSPVAIIRVTSDGTPQGVPSEERPPQNQPQDGTDGSNTINNDGTTTTNNDGNGSKTPVKYVRVPSGKYSPKTGE